MRSRISSSSRLPDFVLLLLVVGLLGMAPSTMRAQTTECVDEPVLEFFDANDDSVLSEEEIRAADPDNAELQGLADRMEDEGVAGLQYTGCVPPGAGTPEGGAPESGTPQGASIANDAFGEGVTTLPESGETSDDGGGLNPAILVIGVGALLALALFLGFRWRNRA